MWAVIYAAINLRAIDSHAAIRAGALEKRTSTYRCIVFSTAGSRHAGDAATDADAGELAILSATDAGGKVATSSRDGAARDADGAAGTDISLMNVVEIFEIIPVSAADTCGILATRGRHRATADGDSATGNVGTICPSATDARGIIVASGRHCSTADGDITTGDIFTRCISATDARAPSSACGCDSAAHNADVATICIYSTTDACATVAARGMERAAALDGERITLGDEDAGGIRMASHPVFAFEDDGGVA